MQEGLGPGHIVLHGDPALLPKKESEPPFFGPCLLRPNAWMHQDATWCGGRPQPRRLCVRWGRIPSQKGGGAPQFTAHLYCGQMAAGIKMPIGTEVGLGPDDIVLDGDPASPPQKGAEPPLQF